MTQEAISKIKRKIRKDGSLSEERKNKLLDMLATIVPEMTKLFKSQTENAKNTIGYNNMKVNVWKKNK